MICKAERWLRDLIAKADKGTLDNVDARAVGRALEEIEARKDQEIARLRGGLKWLRDSIHSVNRPDHEIREATRLRWRQMCDDLLDNQDGQS